MIRENISKLFHGQKIYKYVVPIQSFAQLVTAILSAGLAALISFMIGKLFDSATQSISASIFLGIFTMYFTLYSVLPAHFSIAIAPKEKNHWLKMIGRKLDEFGYSNVKPDTENCLYYRMAKARWFHWKEIDFHVTYHDHLIKVEGPIVATGRLRDFLAQSPPSQC